MKRKIGLIVAIELDAVFALFEKVDELEAPQGFKLYKVEKENYDIFILKSGMGLVYASAGTQYLISACKVETVVNFGVAGSMDSSISKQKVCLVDRIVHYRYDCSQFLPLEVGQVEGQSSKYLICNSLLKAKALEIDPTLVKVTCCSGDKFVADIDEKKNLKAQFNAQICDMECAGIFLTCEANNIPCLFFKAIADGLLDGAEGYFKELFKASVECLKITCKIIESI